MSADRSDRFEGTGRRVEGATVAILVVAFGVVAGVPGAIGGLLVASVWYALGVPYALALGHVVLAALISAEDLASLLAVEAVLVALLLSAAFDSPTPARTAAVAAGFLVGLAALAGLTLAFQPTWVAAVVLCGAIATLAYGVHRYERVWLDLHGDAAERPTETTTEHT